MNVVPPADVPVILSDGEVLSSQPWPRLGELRRNSDRLAAKLGRTDHYRAKNRTALERIASDLEKVESEIKRRWGLTTLTMCGVVWNLSDITRMTLYAPERDGLPRPLRAKAIKETIPPRVDGGYRSADGEWVETFSTPRERWTARSNRSRFVRPDAFPQSGGGVLHRLEFWDFEIADVLRYGGRIVKSEDPFAPGYGGDPWTVAEPDPWTVLDFDPEEGRG